MAVHGSSYIRLAALLLWQATCFASTAVPQVSGPRPETVQAFDRYVRMSESLLDARLQGMEDFLWPRTAEIREQLRQGRVSCAPRNKKGDLKVSYGLIHDWVGAVFIPDVTLDEVLKIVQDYDNHKKTYRQEVMDSRVLERSGNDFRVYLRLLKRKVITVVLDTEHEVRYLPVNRRHWHSRSRSTRIVEIGSRGNAAERPSCGRDHGFLWRLNSYWNFLEEDGGVYVECEAISLSRGVPRSLAFMLDPIVRTLPKDALTGTLLATRAALAGSRRAAAPSSPAPGARKSAATR